MKAKEIHDMTNDELNAKLGSCQRVNPSAAEVFPRGSVLVKRYLYPVSPQSVKFLVIIAHSLTSCLPSVSPL